VKSASLWRSTATLPANSNSLHSTWFEMPGVDNGHAPARCHQLTAEPAIAIFVGADEQGEFDLVGGHD
jgi:hypothetical protein